MSQPLRGEVWWIDLGIAGKVRPAVVISAPIADTDFALIATIPHTTSDHPSQYSLKMHVSGLKDGSFNLQAMAGVPASKFIRKISTLTPDQIVKVDEAMRRWLALHA